MKHLIVIGLLLSISRLSAQTPQLELDALNRRMFSKEISTAEATLINKDLTDIIKEGLYPQLPYDTLTHDFMFEYVFDCPGMTKDAISKRIKEWCALEYGDFQTVLKYEDPESGKIIVKGFIEIPYSVSFETLFGFKKNITTSSRCYHGLAFTIKDGKVKLNITALTYMISSGGYSSGISYVPYAESRRSFGMLFPIVNQDQNVRRPILDFAKNAAKEFMNIRLEVDKYIKNYQNDYKF